MSFNFGAGGTAPQRVSLFWLRNKFENNLELDGLAHRILAQLHAMHPTIVLRVLAKTKPMTALLHFWLEMGDLPIFRNGVRVQYPERVEKVDIDALFGPRTNPDESLIISRDDLASLMSSVELPLPDWLLPKSPIEADKTTSTPIAVPAAVDGRAPLISSSTSVAPATDEIRTSRKTALESKGRGAKRRILEIWDDVEKVHGPQADGSQVLRVLKRHLDPSEKAPSLKTVQNRLIELRKQKLIP